MGRHHCGYAEVEAGAERDVESLRHELTGELRLSAEAVDDPGLSGTHVAVEGDELLPGTDGVDDQGLADGFGEPRLTLKHGQLHVDGRPAEGVDPSLADSHHAGKGGKLLEATPGVRPGKGGAPGVYAGGIVPVGAQRGHGSVGGIDAYHCIGRGIVAMGVNVGKGEHGGGVHGTGS